MACLPNLACVGGTCVNCGAPEQICCPMPAPSPYCRASTCRNGRCVVDEGPPGIFGAPSDYGNPGWQSSFFVVGCQKKDGPYCVNLTPCPAEGLKTVEKYPIGGVQGQHYKVTFFFHAVTAPKVYEGGKRDRAGLSTDYQTGLNDTFYRDGAPTNSTSESWKLSVYDDKGLVARHFYMNSVLPGAEAPLTLLVSYTKSIVVVGGGHIEHTIDEPDCRTIDNCGAGELLDATCSAPRLLPDEPATTMLPPYARDPASQFVVATPTISAFSKGLSQPWRAQWGHLQVTAIEVTTDPVVMDY